MDILSNIYSKTVSENERNLHFWEDYLKSLKELDFKVYSEKLTVPVLVPIGSRILFRGELKHTNEVTVSLGADYFAKCSIAQAEILRQHRIKDAQSKVNMFREEKEYLENQLTFRKTNIYDGVGQEIVEVYSEEEDKAWRKQHRENVRQYKIKSKNEVENKEEITDEELWNRLEELELQEELESEVGGNTQDLSQNNKLINTFVTEEENVRAPMAEDLIQEQILERKPVVNQNILGKNMYHPTQTSKLDLLQKVINRQNELDEKLQELKQKERSRSKTESDLMARLDEMEQLDELEDEMDRLDDLIEGEDADTEEEDIDSDEEVIPNLKAPVIKRSVSFADEDDSETLELSFKHSDASPCTDPYDPSKGIQKPSDIYSAYSHLFTETTSILKKSKYSDKKALENINQKQDFPSVTLMQTEEDDEEDVNRTIVVKDVIERDVIDQNGNVIITDSRPTSLFKKKRMQNK